MDDHPQEHQALNGPGIDILSSGTVMYSGRQGERDDTVSTWTWHWCSIWLRKIYPEIRFLSLNWRIIPPPFFYHPKANSPIRINIPVCSEHHWSHLSRQRHSCGQHGLKLSLSTVFILSIIKISTWRGPPVCLYPPLYTPPKLSCDQIGPPLPFSCLSFLHSFNCACFWSPQNLLFRKQPSQQHQP